MMARRHGIALAAATLLCMASPALAQIDISGEWGSRLHEDLQHRSSGAALGDYTGLPLNDAARQKAQSWDASILSSPEEQAKPHPAQYHMRGPGTNLRIVKVIDPFDQHLISYTIAGLFGRADRIIWMDGRPHPSKYAEHTWTGFSTGKIVGNKLVVTTTHMKAGVINRNGSPASAKSTMTEYFVRHGDLLSMASIIDDPIYLDEPFIRTMTWVYSPNLGVDNRMLFEVVEEVAAREKDYVPAYPLGTIHGEFANTFKLPFEITQGGGESLYPEYILRIRQLVRGETPSPSAYQPPIPTGGKSAPDVETVRVPPGELEVVPVRKNIYMLVGAGANVTVQVGDEGVLVVDAGEAAGSDKLVGAIRRLSTRPIRYLVTTHAHAESVGGTAAVVKAGGPRVSAVSARPAASDIPNGVAVVAHENVNTRLSAVVPRLGEDALPTSTFYGERKDLFFNGEAIELHAQPSAHTDGDLIAFFRVSDVVSAGGILDTTRYPMIDVKSGGSLKGIIEGLTRLVEIAVPARNQMDGTLVIPEHGRLCNESDVVEYRNMVIIIRDRLRAMGAKGMTLEQVKAARPTLDYDGVYGATTGTWTTDMFIEAAYVELRAGAAR